jgi:hypothetical protein
MYLYTLLSGSEPTYVVAALVFASCCIAVVRLRHIQANAHTRDTALTTVEGLIRDKCATPTEACQILGAVSTMVDPGPSIVPRARWSATARSDIDRVGDVAGNPP